MTRQSDTIGKLAAALARAHGKMPEIPKGKTAKVRSKRTDTEYSYNYADIADILKLVRPILAAEELAVIQATYMNDQVLMLESRIVHSSGEWMSSTYPVCTIASHQDMGGALTYARRYSYCALVGVAADDDDDGASAGAPKPAKQQPTKEAPASNGARAPAAQRNAEPTRGGYGRQKNNVDAVGKGPSYATEAKVPVTADALLTGIMDTPEQVGREGLKDICRRLVAARRHIEKGDPLPPQWPADQYTVRALNDAYDLWRSWHRQVDPKLSEADKEKVLDAIGAYGKAAKALDDAVAKKAKAAAAKRQADAEAAGADPKTGELPEYEEAS
jgi:hypothetical protein